jgi:hypothetical protein
MEPSDTLHAFRCLLYQCLHRRGDALFELTDSLLTAESVPSPVHLSLQPSHRRGWGSLYAALDRGRIDAEALRGLLAHHPLAGSATPPVYAVDVSVWPRCDAEASPERGYYYHPSRHSAGQPIVAGWAYQFIARLNFVRESWTAPVDVERVRPMEDANEVAAEQVKAFLRRSSSPEEGATPLFVFDAGYDPVKVQQGLKGSPPCQILVRLRAGRRFYAEPSLAGPPAHTGRPRRHGPKMKCKDPSTWPDPSTEYTCEDAGYGAVRVRAWANLHPKVRAHEGQGSRGPLPIVRGTLVLVEVERLPRGERRREPRVLWLWWHGEGEPDLGLLWRAYVRRFDLEHTFRFLKQTLGWSTPRLRHPEQADRWTWLVLAAFTQLRLARLCVADLRLPWERRYDSGRLTPVRVHRVVSALLAELGTPAKPPKPCGRSPGRPKGRLSGRAKRYPAFKKAA